MIGPCYLLGNRVYNKWRHSQYLVRVMPAVDDSEYHICVEGAQRRSKEKHMLGGTRFILQISIHSYLLYVGKQVSRWQVVRNDLKQTSCLIGLRKDQTRKGLSAALCVC